jgi:hypothetical protein
VKPGIDISAGTISNECKIKEKNIYVATEIKYATLTMYYIKM